MDKNQFNNGMNEYFSKTNANNRKDMIKRIIVLIIALVHGFVLYPYIKSFIEDLLIKNNIDSNIIEYVLMGYVILSFLFVLISAWQVVKNIKVLNVVFVIAVLAYTGIYGYAYIQTTKLYSDITNKPKASFVIEAKELCNNAKTYWQKETITSNSKRITYIKKGKEYCNNKKLAYVDDKTEYAITVNERGNIIDFKITNGKFQYVYNGEGLMVDDINSNMFIKVDSNNSIIIPECY